MLWAEEARVYIQDALNKFRERSDICINTDPTKVIPESSYPGKGAWVGAWVFVPEEEK
jgi:hypothetical protein